MQTLHVELGERSYPIYIGAGLLADPELLTRHIGGRQVAVVTNETVAPLYLETLMRSLEGFKVASIVLPDVSMPSMIGTAATAARCSASTRSTLTGH